MTLIPLLSATLLSPRRQSAASAGSVLARGSYNPGSRHRPVAVTLAVGLPAALLVAVILSPMVVDRAPQKLVLTGTLITLPKPKPPEPDEVQVPQPPTHLTAPMPTTDPILLSPIKVPLLPVIGDVPPIGDPGPTIITPPQPPALAKLVEARIDPRYKAFFQPEYPAREQRSGTEGMAKVRVLIGTDGRVKAVEEISATSPGFFEETRRRALSKWRFTPATRDGVAQESWQVMTVRFQIRNG